MSLETSTRPIIKTFVTGGEKRFVTSSIIKAIEDNYHVSLNVVGWVEKHDKPSGEMPQADLILHIKSMASHAHRIYAKKWADRFECMFIETTSKFSHSKEQYDMILLPYLTKNHPETLAVEAEEGQEEMIPSFDQKALKLEQHLLTRGVYDVLPYIKDEQDRFNQWVKNVENQGFDSEALKEMLSMWKFVGSYRGNTNEQAVLSQRTILKSVKEAWVFEYLLTCEPKNLSEVEKTHKEIFGAVLSKSLSEKVTSEWFKAKEKPVEEVIPAPQPVIVTPKPVILNPQPVIVAPKPVIVAPKPVMTVENPIVHTLGMYDVIFDDVTITAHPKFGVISFSRLEAKRVKVGSNVCLSFESLSDGVFTNVKVQGV